MSNCFFFQAEDGIRVLYVTGVQTCALPISPLEYSRNDNWDSMLRQGIGLLEAFARENRVAVPEPHQNLQRSEERRVGKECRPRCSPPHDKQKTDGARGQSIDTRMRLTSTGE